MIAQPEISVLLPVYNGENYIENSIESLINQTLTDFEIIIINDGSTDNTQKICEYYSKQDSRILTINQNNKGIVKALNNALFHANGKFCARMDADDIALPNRFQKQISIFHQNDKLAVLGGHAYIIDEAGNLVRPFPVELNHIEIDDLLLRRKKYSGKIALIHPATMFRTQLAKSIGGYRDEYIWAEDLDFFLRMGECGELKNLDETLIYYRVHGKSISKNKFELQEYNAIRAINAAYTRRGLTEQLSDTLHHKQSTNIQDTDIYLNTAVSAANNRHTSSVIYNLNKSFLLNPMIIFNIYFIWALFLLIAPNFIIISLRKYLIKLIK